MHYVAHIVGRVKQHAIAQRVADQTSPSPSPWPRGKGQTTCGWAARKVRIDRCCSFVKIARTQSWMLKNPGRLFIIVHFNNPLSSEVGTCLALHVPPQSSSVPSPLWPIMPPPNTITLITTMRWAPEAECKESSHAILRNLCHISITKSTTISTTTPHNWQHHHLHHLHHHHHLPRDIAQLVSHLYHQVHHHHHWHNNTITSTIYTIITISNPSITELQNPYIYSSRHIGLHHHLLMNKRYSCWPCRSSLWVEGIVIAVCWQPYYSKGCAPGTVRPQVGCRLDI